MLTSPSSRSGGVRVAAQLGCAPRYKSVCLPHPLVLRAPSPAPAALTGEEIRLGDAETGVTRLWPNKGMDHATNPPAEAQTVIAEDNTISWMYLNTLYPMGIDAMVEAVNINKSGNAPAIVQDESKATCEQAMPRRARPKSILRNRHARCSRPDPQMQSAARRLRDRRGINVSHGFVEPKNSAGELGRRPGNNSCARSQHNERIALASKTRGSGRMKRARIDPTPKKVADPTETAKASYGNGGC